MITYTNRKDVTYTLCKGSTKTGKSRYFFAREPQGESVEAIPEGYEIRESVNGVVSLAKVRPGHILAEEVAVVAAAIQRHPRGRNYRVDVKPDRIDIYELVGGGMDEVLAIFNAALSPALLAKMRADRECYGQYTAVLRFILTDAEHRLFRAERMCYRSSVDGWLPLYNFGAASIEQLARRLVPTLGTDAFFGLY
jgi:hypothetical protein